MRLLIVMAPAKAADEDQYSALWSSDQHMTLNECVMADYQWEFQLSVSDGSSALCAQD